MNKICYGCGAKLQSKDINKEGYIPLEKLEGGGYCQRCFKMIHYGINNGSNTPKEINEIINSVNNDNKFVIFLVDFLSLSERVFDIFGKIKGRKLLLISKCDIIPKSVKYSNLVNFIKNNYNVKSDIKFISTISNTGVSAVLNYLEDNNIKESYILGLSNSGKSTFINKIIELTNSNMKALTTSKMPNTTLDFIRLNINGLTLTDSPGFIIDGVNVLIKGNLKGYIKPKTFQMKIGETLKIDDSYLFFNESTSITIYTSNEVIAKKYFKNDLHFENMVELDDNSDLVILGLGFINIKNKCNIKILNINPDLIEVRESIFGDL